MLSLIHILQRKEALRVASTYRTVSEPAVMVISGFICIDLLAKEGRAVHFREGEIGDEMAKHQERLRNLDRYQIVDEETRWR